MLKELGWDVLEVWECEAGDNEKLQDSIKGFLK